MPENDLFIGQRLFVTEYAGKLRADHAEIVNRRSFATDTMLTVKLLDRPQVKGRDQFRNFYVGKGLKCHFVK